MPAGNDLGKRMGKTGHFPAVALEYSAAGIINSVCVKKTGMSSVTRRSNKTCAK